MAVAKKDCVLKPRYRSRRFAQEKCLGGWSAVPAVIGRSAHQSFAPDETLSMCPNGTAQCNPGGPDTNQESESEE